MRAPAQRSGAPSLGSDPQQKNVGAPLPPLDAPPFPTFVKGGRHNPASAQAAEGQDVRRRRRQGRGFHDARSGAELPAKAPLDGLVITRYQHGLLTNRINVIEAAHPVPDENGDTGPTRTNSNDYRVILVF